MAAAQRRRPGGRRAATQQHERGGHTPASTPGQVRIIGGRWRGRRLPVGSAPGLRPSGDRVRETLFNWLQGLLVDARCLDLFAGSGALGLEALSRGAAHCTFVDNEASTLQLIRGALQDFGASAQAQCTHGSALDFLGAAHGPYDLIFLDPPFGSGLLNEASERLQASGACHPDTRIYVEREAGAQHIRLPVQWQALREKRTGTVQYGLYRPMPSAD